MNVTKEFESNPEEFLTRYIVNVIDPAETKAYKETGLIKFVFWKTGDGRVDLKKPLLPTPTCVEAYWLPWKTYDITTMDLGEKAKYFFTSMMSNCRFSVLTDNMKSPKVAHLAGTWSHEKREEAEKKWLEKESLKGAKVRRLSISGVNAHGYGGQDVKGEGQAMAFVYGIRAESGWTIRAQVTKGDCSKIATGDVKDFKIWKPFSFVD